MTAPTPQTIRRRLERAGFVYASGWVSREEAQRVAEWAEYHRADVAKLTEEPPKPRGRPKKA